ncbi:bacteriohemerythrin [Thermodesulfobacterium sp. TA1]|uniref:bacteriohemerythrin n=1 Tax=Thermodesulfobacterium sp. TA1 TaxID=2234087 RepID=UPI001232A2EB|nr:bacteriohemerythrin [Thermodesulfobacterium sp. TA1]QER42084.1 bacteriohemerythrin [Thermodesulfobacterium sp. TA1]
MDYIEWNSDFEIGIKFIDNQHKMLVHIINRLYTTLFLKPKFLRENILEILQELRDYTQYHFEAEEAFMESHDYPKLSQHKRAHQDFIKKIEEFYAKLPQEDLKAFGLELLSFLKKWLLSHILTLDKHIKTYLTGLPIETPLDLYKVYGFFSKEELLEKFTELINHRREVISFMIFDIDDFYFINLRYGFDVGDLILEDFAKHLSNKLKEPNLWLGKFEGDRFAILLTDNESFLRTFQTIEKVFKVVENYRFELLEEERFEFIKFKISLGVVLYPKHGTDPKDLLIKAEIALKKAKEEGKNRWIMFTEQDYLEIKKTDEVKSILDEVLEKELVFPFIQPIFSTKHKKVVGGEVLLRIYSEKENRVISAGEFVKVALNLGYLDRLEEIMFKKLKNHPELPKFKGYMLFINRAITSFEKFERLIYEIEDWITLTQKVGCKMVLEVTEVSLINFVDLVPLIKEKTRQNNIFLAVDDFGAGYASFSYLLKFKPDFIKLDGDFVKECLQTEDNLKVLRGIVRLAKDLKVKTIAEFVENQEIMDMLVKSKVDLLQGYHLGKPMPVEDFVKIYLTK